VILGEPAHKIVNANLYQVDETLALYARITAPTLSVVASDCQLGQWWQGRYTWPSTTNGSNPCPTCTTRW
jgi:hypothetical protein